MSFLRPWQGLALLCALVLLVLSACGSDDDQPEDETPTAPVARAADFPKPQGLSITDLRESLDPGPKLAPSLFLLKPGKNRFGFALFDQANKQIGDSPTALYLSDDQGNALRGPFPARWESLEVKPAFQSETVASDPDAAKGLYVADLEFAEPGRYGIMAVAKLDDRFVASEPTLIEVPEKSPVPDVGEKAIKVSTLTRDDVGDVSEIDTREPPSTMHEHDFADVLGERPVILVFATPALCASRVCAPVVDVAEQVKAANQDVVWIHQEIYNENEVEKGFREPVRKWKLPSEPWVFAINAKGRVAARLEGAFSPAELQKAVDAAKKG